jgi:hypothetical protein
MRRRKTEQKDLPIRGVLGDRRNGKETSTLRFGSLFYAFSFTVLLSADQCVIDTDAVLSSLLSLLLSSFSISEWKCDGLHVLFNTAPFIHTYMRFRQHTKQTRNKQ